MTRVAAAAPDLLDEGLARLEEQRLAMIARDAARLEAANAALSEWIGACRSGNEDVEATARSARNRRLRELRGALDANAVLARRASLQAARAFTALAGSQPTTYDDQGFGAARAARRGVFSA
ncbi:MAG: hypothetical protein M9885_02775 [Burkholderiaceae bacterium]|nr:hypothetical protein [Burkholderiaceae bacterium]